jgi:hypothetical protein
LLDAHADALEHALEREEGLETGMQVRDVELESRRAQIATCQAQIATCHEQLEERRREIAALHAEALAMTQANHAANLEREIAEQHVAALKSSLSWRLTQPLRALAELLAFPPRR